MNMTRRRALGLIAASTLLAACGKSVKLAAIAPGKTVLAFGDSVTFGTGAAPGEDWPSRIAARTGWRVINAGVPGDTAEAGKNRLPALLAEHRPDLVIVEIGGNDFLRRRPDESVKEDIRQMLRGIRQQGAAAVLVAVPAFSLMSAVGKPADSPIYQALGKEEKIPVIADVFSGVLGRAELRADPIHPNAQGYARMAAEMTDRLRELGLFSGSR